MFFSLLTNRQVLATRLEHVKNLSIDHEAHLSALKREGMNMERKTNALKLDVRKLGKQMDQYKSLLLSRGLSAEMMDQWLEQTDPLQTPQLVSLHIYLQFMSRTQLLIYYFELWMLYVL